MNRHYISVGSWSIGDGNKKTFLVDRQIRINMNFIYHYHLDSYGYGEFFEHVNMPTVKDATDWIERTVISNFMCYRERVIGYEIKADNTAREVLEFLKKEDPTTLICPIL